jgi:hypothetical protein
VPAGWTICGIPAGTYPGASLVFFKEVTANTPTTTLTLYFDKIIPGLDANNIALTVPSGKTMVKGGFSRTSTTPGMVEYTLGVTCSGGGSGYVEVTVSRPGYIIYTHNGSPLADTAWF